MQHQKVRSISIRGVPRAAHRIARVLVNCHPSHEDKDVEEMMEICREALEEPVLRINREDGPPTDERLDTGRRLQAADDFVEYSPLLSSE